MAAQPRIETILFDLDGTLYPIENGYEDHVRDNIFSFMHQKLGVPWDQCKATWRPLFAQTNQSLKGLRVGGYQFDTDEYWDFIRDGREQYLKPDPKVRECLLALPQKKWVFTNCNEKHARLALETLDLLDLFDGVLGADLMGEHAKPDAEAFQKVLAKTRANPSSTAMFEDSLRNLKQAKKLGMTTVLIQSKTMLEETGYALHSVRDMPEPALDAIISLPHIGVRSWLIMMPIECAEENELRKEANELRTKENILLQAQMPEVQTQALLQLVKKFDSVASSLRLAKSAEFVYSPSNASSVRDPDFKLQLIKAYQPSSYDETRNKPYQTCKSMVLDVSLPTGYVTAPHLFKFKWHMRIKEVLGFDNINNSRNELLLAKPIEEAFDAGYLCFIPDQDGVHCLHLLDSRLSDVKLTDMKQYPWLKPLSQDKMSKEGKQQDLIKDAIQALKESSGDIPTFATLQGKQLHFEGDERPFKRCLAFQASQSRHSALSQGRISPLDVPEINGSAWSNNSYLDRVKDYLSAPFFQFPSGPMDRLDNISEQE